ncbi:MAG: tetratricopeptide repeat protein [Oscillospiraceae bacterium]|nr:tetratricopeptide repeat protein [Oscillospiraceae bacterium]
MLDSVYTIIGLISFVLFLTGVLTGLAHICKRLVEAHCIRNCAIKNIGNEVSIYNDKGAKLAYKGICAYLNEDHSKALTYLENAVRYSQVSHNSAFCFDWMSRCYEALGKYRESLNCCVKAVEAEPSNIKALFGLANMYVRNGAFSKAEFYYNRVLRYDQKNSYASFMLGTLFMGRGLYDKAEEQFLKTIELNNESEEAFAELSVVMAIKGDYSRMDSYFAEVTKSSNGKYTDSDRLRKRLNSIKKMKDL